MVQAHPYGDLKRLSDRELIALHDKLAASTDVGLNYALDELHRREIERQTAASRTVMAFIDAGFVRPLAAALHNSPDEKYRLDGWNLVTWLRNVTLERFVRAYVYDANFAESDRERLDRRKQIARDQRELRETRGLQLRLGLLVGHPPRQKGVDTLMAIDLLEMAQNSAYDYALVFAGDADFVDAIEAVQRRGRTVRLVMPENASEISDRLIELADETVLVLNDDLADFVRPRPEQAPAE